MNELCHLWRSERYEACGDDGAHHPGPLPKHKPSLLGEGGPVRTLGRMRGKLSVHFKPARERPSGRYFSPAKSTQKPPGTQGQAAFTSLMPPFPRTPFGVRSAAAASNDPPNLKVVACRFGTLRTVTATPEQRYPPRLATLCNSSAISTPHGVSALCFSLRPRQKDVSHTEQFPAADRKRSDGSCPNCPVPSVLPE